MIDWTQVETLKEDIGAEDFAEVVGIFLDEVSEALEALDSNAGATELEEGLHFVKGSARNLGFAALADLCAAGEASAAQKQTADIDLPAVHACYSASREAFLTGIDS